MSEDEGPLAFLARSETRKRTLRQLAAEGPAQRATLVDRLDVSDRTVKRALDRFERRGWIRTTSSAYAITALGKHVLETYGSAIDKLAVGDKLAPLLKRVRPSQCELPIETFREAEVVTATGNSPNTSIERTLAFRQNADRVRELSSLVTKESATQLAQRIRNDDLEYLEVVLERSVLDTIQDNPGYRESFQDVVEADEVSIFVYDDALPCLIVLVEDGVAVAVTDETGLPAAVAIAHAPDAYEWGETTYERIRAEATPIAESRAAPGSTRSVESDSEYH